MGAVWLLATAALLFMAYRAAALGAQMRKRSLIFLALALAVACGQVARHVPLFQWWVGK